MLHIRHDGQITNSVFPKTCQPLVAKIFRFSEYALHAITASPRAPGGRIAIANGSLGAGCDGRRPASVISPDETPGRRTAKPCGPGAATVASIRPACAGTATVTRTAAHRGATVFW